MEAGPLYKDAAVVRDEKSLIGGVWKDAINLLILAAAGRRVKEEGNDLSSSQRRPGTFLMRV